MESRGYLFSYLSHHSCKTQHQWIIYRQNSNINGTLGGNKIVIHSDVVGAEPVGLYQRSDAI